MCLDVALATIGFVEPQDARIVRIHNTLDLAEVLASEAYRSEAEQRDDLSIVEPLKEMEFDARGDLLPF